MELKTYFAQDRNGSLIPSATVAIYLTGTTTLATGLKNVSGANLANPFSADADGKIQFYAPDGIYDMQVSLGSTTGVKVTFQCLDVQQQLTDANSAADRAEDARDAAEAAAGTVGNSTFEVASEAAMLVLAAKKGDIVLRTDINKTLRLTAVPASTLANWKAFIDDDLETLSQSNGATKVGHDGKTVADYLLANGRIVSQGDDLKDVLESADNGDVVYVNGDVTLNASVVLSKAVSIKQVNNGRILWNGPGNACIRYVLPVKNTITTAVQFSRGANTATLPGGHGVVVGDFLEVRSTMVRYTDAADGDYTHGQLICVEKVDGDKITFVPSIVNGFTSSEIIVTDTLNNLDFDIEIVTVKASTGTATGILLDIHSARNLQGRFRIKGNGDEQYGLAIMGYNCRYSVDVWDITSGSGSYNVPGYGVNVVGNSIHGVVSGGRCRHIFEVPARNILSDDIKFHVDGTKSEFAPQFLYAAGWHANVERIEVTGTLAGSGFLLGVRSGTGDISVNFIGADDGYEYADIYVANRYPESLKIHRCHSSGANSRRNFVHWDINGQSSNNSGLIIDNNTFVGPKRIIRFTDTSAATTKVYRAFISNNKGGVSAIHNRDLPSANVYLELYNNQLSSYGVVPAYADFMAGVDTGGCKTYEVHSANNFIEDSTANGVFSFDGYMDGISFSSQADKNAAKPFIRLTPTYLGRIDRMDINGLNTSGLMTLTPTAATVFNDIGQVRFCRIGYDSASPIAVGLSWPVVYTGNAFKTTLDATLVSTKRPQGGNVNLTNKALNWNGTNIAV